MIPNELTPVIHWKKGSDFFLQLRPDLYFGREKSGEKKAGEKKRKKSGQKAGTPTT